LCRILHQKICVIITLQNPTSVTFNPSKPCKCNKNLSSNSTFHKPLTCSWQLKENNLLSLASKSNTVRRNKLWFKINKRIKKFHFCLEFFNFFLFFFCHRHRPKSNGIVTSTFNSAKPCNTSFPSYSTLHNPFTLAPSLLSLHGPWLPSTSSQYSLSTFSLYSSYRNPVFLSPWSPQTSMIFFLNMACLVAYSQTTWNPTHYHHLMDLSKSNLRPRVMFTLMMLCTMIK